MLSCSLLVSADSQMLPALQVSAVKGVILILSSFCVGTFLSRSHQVAARQKLSRSAVTRSSRNRMAACMHFNRMLQMQTPFLVLTPPQITRKEGTAALNTTNYFLAYLLSAAWAFVRLHCHTPTSLWDAQVSAGCPADKSLGKLVCFDLLTL